MASPCRPAQTVRDFIMKTISDPQDRPSETGDLSEKAMHEQEAPISTETETETETETTLDPEVPEVLVWDDPPDTIEQQQQESAGDPPSAPAVQ
jgi:hypothetical protein